MIGGGCLNTQYCSGATYSKPPYCLDTNVSLFSNIFQSKHSEIPLPAGFAEACMVLTPNSFDGVHGGSDIAEQSRIRHSELRIHWMQCVGAAPTIDVVVESQIGIMDDTMTAIGT